MSEVLHRRRGTDPIGKRPRVINPATERPIATIALGCEEDVNRAVAAARRASSRSRTPARRVSSCSAGSSTSTSRAWTDCGTLSRRWGAIRLARDAQALSGLGHLSEARAVLKLRFPEDVGTARIVREPIGVCGRSRLELAAQSDHRQGRPGDRGGLHHGAEAQQIAR
jgi:aldehyde dehydrogenase (NAD+)